MVRNVHEIEEAVAALPPDDLRRFRSWFEAFVPDAWDAEMAEDADAGRLDELVREARAEHERGETRAL